MYEPSRAQDEVAERLALRYGRAGVERFPDSTVVLVSGFVPGEHSPLERLLVTPDGGEEEAYRPVKLYPGVFAVYQGRTLVADSQVASLIEARDAADEMNASYA